MHRAAVLIGVADTGGYVHLEAVGKGIDDVHNWILRQDDFDKRIEVLTDLDGQRVTVGEIKEAVGSFVQQGTIEQLLIYFAGHGMNVGYQEFWLLTDAPDDPNAAVNLAGSVVQARHCGIPHVVFISDACRSAADSITAQTVNGSVIFPNPGPRREPGVVDVFYAAAVGDPALEVRPPNAAANDYQAIYTTALVIGLSGAEASIIEPSEQPGRGVIRPWPLKRYLPGAVTALLRRAGLQLTESQVPDAVISSPPESWLATVNAAPASHSGLRRERTSATPETLSALSELTVTKAISGHPLDPYVIVRAAAHVPGAQALVTHIEVPLVSQPVHFSTHCGFVVNGMRLRRAHVRRAAAELVGNEKAQVQVSPTEGQPVTVLLEFDNGTGTLLPAIPDFVGTLTFDAERLMAVSYEPAADTLLRSMAEPDLPAVAELRRAIAATARLGTFRLNPDSAGELISRIRNFKFVDPCLAVYAVHALADLGRHSDIADVDDYVWRDLHLHLFDVALLRRVPGDSAAPMPPEVHPAVPLLTQGWPLLEAYSVRLPANLGLAKRHLTNSLWTMFRPNGVTLMTDAITDGAI